MNKNLEYLQGRVSHHEDRANYYYKQVKALEDKERLIGFKMTNDNRQSTDGVFILSSRITAQDRL